MNYKEYFLRMEAEMALKKEELKKIIEPQVEAQLATQMESVCAEMKPKLIAAWESGSLGEDIPGEVFISIPEGPLPEAYQDVLNEVVREKLSEYGFTPYFNCAKSNHPEIAEVHFNFTRDFYEERNNWCSWVAHEYFMAKVKEVENTLNQVVYFHNLSCCTSGKSPFSNKVEVTVKLPPAARLMVGKRVCVNMGCLDGFVLRDLDKIIFGLK